MSRTYVAATDEQEKGAAAPIFAVMSEALPADIFEAEPRALMLACLRAIALAQPMVQQAEKAFRDALKDDEFGSLGLEPVRMLASLLAGAHFGLKDLHPRSKGGDPLIAFAKVVQVLRCVSDIESAGDEEDDLALGVYVKDAAPAIAIIESGKP